MEGVKERLQHLVEKHGGGARLTVYQHGTLLLDSCCGPVQESSLFYVASCTKFVTNVCVARLVDQGVLRYDAKVSEYWPNFHANDVSLQELLSHQAGLVHFDEMIDFPTKALSGRSDEEWQSWIAFLERQKPVSPKNQAAYHAVTVGFYVGVIVFLATGKRLVDYYDEEIRIPFGVEFYFGSQKIESQEHRLTRIVQGSHDDKSKRRKPTALSAQAYMPMNNMSSFWKLRDCESPSHIGWGHAQGLAWLMQLVVQCRLFSPSTLSAASALLVDSQKDLVLEEPMRYTRGGFMKLDENAWGHSGMGGHFVLCDPRYGLSMAFTTNSFLNDAQPRREELIRAVYSALEVIKARL